MNHYSLFMNKYYFHTVVLILLLTACTQHDSAIEYKCDNGNVFNVAYLTTSDNEIQAQIQIASSQYNLPRVPSASGEKYSDGRYTWWTKGDSAFLVIDNIIASRNCISQIDN